MFDRMQLTATRTSQSIQMEADYFGGFHGPPNVTRLYLAGRYTIVCMEAAQCTEAGQTRSCRKSIRQPHLTVVT